MLIFKVYSKCPKTYQTESFSWICLLFCKNLTRFSSNQKKFTISRLIPPKKLVKLNELNAFVYILQKSDVFSRYQYLEEHFESSRISSSSWIQVTLVSARKTLLEIKSTAIDTCLTDRRNEGQKVLLTLTFNSKFSKVDFAKSGSKLTLPKKPDKPAKNPDNTECEIPRIPIKKISSIFFLFILIWIRWCQNWLFGDFFKNAKMCFVHFRG